MIERTLSHLNLNKLCRPTPRTWLRRDRLLAQLESLHRCKLALLCAEAGYGKTTLLLDFLHEWPHPAVWYRLDKADRDVSQFVAYLTAGISQHFPGLGSDVSDRIASELGQSRDTELRHLLLYEMSALAPRPFLLVLDGFESVVVSQEVCALVSDLLEYTGPDMHFAITSRTLPPIPIARLQTRRDLVMLGAGDLAFSVEESRALLAELHQVGLSDAQVGTLWQRTRGWAAGLVMTAEALHRSRPEEVVASLGRIGGTPDLVYRYFADEVFNDLGADLQQFLINTSILKTLSHDIVNDLLGIHNAGELLAGLKEGGTFAHAVETGGGDLRYHPLFRSFLLQKLHERRGDEQIRDLYHRAARAARRYRYWGDAIDYYSAVEDWVGVGEIAEEVGEQLTRRGRLETVRYWIDRIPDQHVRQGPMLLMLRGRLLRQAGSYHAALRDLDLALERFEQSGDVANTVLTLHEIATVHYWLGEFQSAESVLEEGLRRAADDTLLRGWILADLARNCLGSNDLEKGSRWAEMSVATCSMIGRGRVGATALARAYRFRGRILLQSGEHQRGLQDLAASVELCRKDDVGDLQLAWSLLDLGQALVLQGSFGEASRALDEAEALAHGSRSLLSWVWTWRGTSHRDAGAFDRAEHDYQLARETAQPELAFLRLRQNRTADALHLLQGCLNGHRAKESPGDGAAWQVVHGLALARSGERSSALRELASAVETLRQRGRRHQVASAQWHLARVLVEEGRKAEALKHLEEAVLWACTAGVYHFCWWEPETVAQLWPMALGAGWAPAYLLELARLRFGADQCPLLYEALDTVPQALQPQVAETLRAISRESVVRDVTGDLLQSCHDPTARRQIGQALTRGLIGLHELARLRSESGLTWKEIQVLIGYYLQSGEGQADQRSRRRLAESLAVSEHTLKVHIRNIRRKLDLSGRRRVPYLFL